MSEWFVKNARDAEWVDGGASGGGLYCGFEDEENDPFPQLGINVRVIQPGQKLGRYHRENAQEDFLVLQGECLAIVDGEERTLRKWDLLHCPPGVAHALVAAGDEPLILVCAGARTEEPRNGTVYIADPVARKHGVSVDADTANPREAYAGFTFAFGLPYEEGWLPS